MSVIDSSNRRIQEEWTFMAPDSSLLFSLLKDKADLNNDTLFSH